MQLLHAGIMAGTSWDRAGISEYLCLHNQPEFLQTTAGLQDGRGRLYGAEYEARDTPPAFGNLLHHDAPCSVCYTPSRNTKLVIPSRTTCPTGWTKEYQGYVMGSAQYTNQVSGRALTCVDASAESVPGSVAFVDKAQLYFQEVACSGIPCPPYTEGAEITCVVCTK
jgi:hypothetical protein